MSQETKAKIIVAMKRAILQYETFPEHSTEQELALWSLEQAIEDLNRSNERASKGEHNEQVTE